MARRRLEREARIAVTALDDKGAGVGEAEGFELRVWGALPGETVTARVLRRKRRQLDAVAETVADPHPQRVSSPCPVAHRCSGCALQHLGADAQRARKRQQVADAFATAGVAGPARWRPDIEGPTLGYRRKARLGVRFVAEKGGVLVGFRERGSGRVTDTQNCRVLAPEIGTRLPALRTMIAALSCPRAIPQIEIAVGDDAAAIVLRHMEPLTDADHALLEGMAQDLGWHIYLQPGGPATVARLFPPPEFGPERLHHRMPDSPLEMAFHPLDFMQVNAVVNARLVAAALELLAPRPADRVLDLFCGSGNFSLPLAARCAEVTGMEGSAALVARAEENAARNGVPNARFEQADLYAETFDVSALPAMDLLLLDPPRSGAERICSQLAHPGPRRIVYVSCEPLTLARDAAALEARGYAMTEAGIADMFPHTAHVETLAVFERRDR